MASAGFWKRFRPRQLGDYWKYKISFFTFKQALAIAVVVVRFFIHFF